MKRLTEALKGDYNDKRLLVAHIAEHAIMEFRDLPEPDEMDAILRTVDHFVDEDGEGSAEMTDARNTL